MERRTLAALVLVAAAVTSCGGGGELGEECGEEGATDSECAEGLVCGKPGDGDALECLTICVDQADCPSDQECNGLTGSVKACRPKKTK